MPRIIFVLCVLALAHGGDAITIGCLSPPTRVRTCNVVLPTWLARWNLFDGYYDRFDELKESVPSTRLKVKYENSGEKKNIIK